MSDTNIENKQFAKGRTADFDANAISAKWQERWRLDNLYHTDLENAKRPYYTLMMFPYPSAEGLHIGSIYTFTGVDVFARFKKLQGNDVFEPFGLDAFGIHSENYALKIGTHPMEQAKVSQENFYRQMHETGNMIDWARKLETTAPDYYKWTQWIFIQMFKHGLAIRKKAKVNFCPSCKTVLADEQVIDGQCERCGSVVEKRDLPQWFFKITNYADRLLNNIQKIDWDEKIKLAQKNWIGEKEGITITYPIENSEEIISVFTTRPDTNFGATFIAIAPEHPLVEKMLYKVRGLGQGEEGNNRLEIGERRQQDISEYINSVKNRSEIERQAEGKEKTGVFTGLYAINQLTGYRMPIWISDFVLMGFGTGALVGVPGHDKRDFEFAQKFDLEIKRVVVGKDEDASPITRIEQVQEEDGIMIHSDFLNGLEIREAMKRIMQVMEERGYGERTKTYHLRDWLISRQRYWGPPIPMVFCQKCADEGKSWFDTEEAQSIENSKSEARNSKQYQNSNDKNPNSFRISNSEYAGWYPVSDAELPVLLPYIEDFKPLGTNASPLANHPEFYKTVCPSCGSEARRETDVNDNFLDSSWYFLRYLATDWNDMPFPMTNEVRGLRQEEMGRSEEQKSDVRNEKLDREGRSSKLENQISQRMRWLPVTIYIGGAEHAVLHLLYARFVTMALHDMGYLPFEEPFSKFYAHGLIIKDGAKMSKSKGNVILPEPLIRKFGIDTVRLYLRFIGPFNEGGDFRDTGIEGMHRFVKRVWSLFQDVSRREAKSEDAELSRQQLQMMHQTIKGVTDDMEALRFNTAIAKLMSYYNFLSQQARVSHEEAKVFLQLIAPFAPHLTEELWERIGEKYSIHQSKWPEFKNKFLVGDEITIAIQVNGKVRDILKIPRKQTITEETVALASDKAIIMGLAMQREKIKKYLEGKEIADNDVIYVPEKIINFIV